MKYSSIIWLLIVSALLLSACAANATPTETAVLDNIYTAVASTISAQEDLATPTSTSTSFPTLTPFISSTNIPATATVQNAAYYSAASTANGCNDAKFISDITVDDGTVLAAGQSFTKTWEFQNTGTCDWNENYQLTFVSGNDMDGETTEIDQDVSSGSVADFSVSMIAPSSEGTYSGYWRLADEDGNVFGQSIYVLIVVSDDAATLTPTATPTSEATSTPTTMPTSSSNPTMYP